MSIHLDDRSPGLDARARRALEDLRVFALAHGCSAERFDLTIETELGDFERVARLLRQRGDIPND